MYWIHKSILEMNNILPLTKILDLSPKKLYPTANCIYKGCINDFNVCSLWTTYSLFLYKIRLCNIGLLYQKTISVSLSFTIT